MEISETIVSGRRYNKFGELFITFKVKKEDRTPELDKYTEDCWEDGRSLALVTSDFQKEYEESIAKEPKSSVDEFKEEFSPFQKIRNYYVKNGGLKKYDELKKAIATKKGNPGFPVEDLHLKDMITEEEAWKLLDTLK